MLHSWGHSTQSFVRIGALDGNPSLQALASKSLYSIYWGYYRVYIGVLYRENGKENGNYYLQFVLKGAGFKVIGSSLESPFP